jgi:hypothetical protein
VEFNQLLDQIENWYKSEKPGAEASFIIAKDKIQKIEIRQVNNFPRHPELWINNRQVVHLAYYLLELVQSALERLQAEKSACSLLLTISRPARPAWASIVLVGFTLVRP